MPEISASVGDGAINKSHDVALVQVMLRIVTDAKGTPYLASNYDGSFGDQTKKAIVAFQTDNAKAIEAGEAGKEKIGVIEPGAKTIATLAAALPATHQALRAMAGTKTVYLEGAQGDAQASATSIRGDIGLETTFRGLLATLVDKMYADHKIVLTTTPTGRHRTFAQQLLETATNAGPGESNHQFGRAADIGFKGFQWLEGDGTIKTDALWLNALEKANAAHANAFWDARDAIAKTLPLYRLQMERIHLQLNDQAGFSSVNSLVKLLNLVGKAKWTSGYKSDFGLGGAFYAVGTAKQIWNGSATVTAANLATALTAKEAAAKSTKVIKVTDITAKQISDMQAFLKADFEAADTNWLKWVATP